MVKTTKREIFGWAMFDFANSSYVTVVITAFYSGFFTEYMVPADSAWRNSYWSAALILSTLVAMFLSPVVGTACDFRGRKKGALIASGFVCALATMGLFFVDPGSWTVAFGLIVISNIAFMLSETLCASFLTDLATKENMGRVSGIGWGIGYFGGLGSVALVNAMVSTDAKENFPIFVSENQSAMLATGIFFLVALIPTILWLGDRSRPRGRASLQGRELVKAAIREVSGVRVLIRDHPVLFKFFIAFMLYMAGLDTVIKFVGIYARGEMQFTTTDLTFLFLILQVSAAIGSLGFGFLEGALGPKRTVLATIGLWILSILAIIQIESLANLLGLHPQRVFFIVGLFAGLGLGATQSSSRAIVGLLAPKEKAGEVFGFWGFFGRTAAILGATYGLGADLMDRRLALFMVIGFFAAGGLLLAQIPLHRMSDETGGRQ